MAGREVPKTQRLMGRETPGPPEPCTLPPDQVEGSAACAFKKDHAEGLSLFLKGLAIQMIVQWVHCLNLYVHIVNIMNDLFFIYERLAL